MRPKKGILFYLAGDASVGMQPSWEVINPEDGDPDAIDFGQPVLSKQEVLVCDDPGLTAEEIKYLKAELVSYQKLQKLLPSEMMDMDKAKLSALTKILNMLGVEK